jgi:long-chain acyl-CoA synthetase
LIKQPEPGCLPSNIPQKNGILSGVFMKKAKPFLIGRFWEHVFKVPSQKANIIKNPNPKAQVVFTIPGPTGAGGMITLPPAPYLNLKWAEVGAIVSEMVATLQANNIRKGDRVAILAWNCPEWVWTFLAIQTIGAISVPIYPNSAADQVNFILKNAQAKLVLADDETQLEKLESNPKEPIKGLLFKEAFKNSRTYQSHVLGQVLPPENKPVIFWDPDSPYFGTSDEAEAVLNHVAKFVIGELPLSETERTLFGSAAHGELGFLPYPLGSELPERVSYEDLATLIYTSGSTGVPKGVMLTHGNIARSCMAMHKHGFDFNENDLYLSYLPLAHCYELINGQSICIWFAVPVAFCRVDEVSNALKELKPTVLLGVPAVWRKIKDKIQGQMEKATGTKAALLKWAMAQKKGTLRYCLADSLVFKKIREALGGNLRIMGSGGAPIAPDTLAFFQQIGLNILQGYGLTETSGALTANTPSANKVGTVGTVIDEAEVKLVPEDENAPVNSGVIWARGGPVSPGYWNLPEENAKSYDADGWFNTGDLGELDEDGFLRITGRKKRLLKTDGGKYVAPEKVEKAFEDYAVVQCVVPVGDAKPFIAALIFVNALTARDLLRAKGVTLPEGCSFQFLIEQPTVKEAVETAVKEANLKLEHWETVKKFTIIEDEASVANGLLTATLKVRTEEAIKRYTPAIERFYVKS